MRELIIIALLAIALAIIDRELPEGNEMAILEILTALVKGGMTPVGACAMGGNMMAESRMQANNLQNSKEKPLNFTDDTYTAAIDSGRYSREQFSFDDGGYGLCQWTHYERKPKLYDFAKKNGKSIGDEAMQVQFCLWEQQHDFQSTWDYLLVENDLYQATNRICYIYENPAVKNVQERYEYAKQMYKDYGPILEKIAGGEVSGSNVADIDKEPPSYIMPTVKPGEHTPEACFLMSHLVKLGYDVLWLGLDACLRDFQQKRGLEVDGICGEKTWRELLK